MQLDLEKICMYCMQDGLSGGKCAYCGNPDLTQQAPVNALPLRTILHGQYLIGKVLGHGGFGITYIAVDLTDGHRVAIKEYFPTGLSTRAVGQTMVSQANESEFNYGLKHFMEEARTINALSNTPNIITIEKLFKENNTAYYAMEFLQGCDLRAYLGKHGGKLSFEETMALLSPLMDSLELVHQQGIIHRDIAPDNIFILENGGVKLIDFGAAHAELSQKSTSFALVLKKGYAPVEQYTSNKELHPQGPWTDVHALAATFYRCLTGSVPAESIKRASNPAELTLPIDAGVQITPQQQSVLLKGMALNWKERYHSVGEFAWALRQTATPQKPENKEVVLEQRREEIVEEKRSILDYIFFWRLFKKKEPTPVVNEGGTAPVKPEATAELEHISLQQTVTSPYCLVGVQGVFAGATIMLYSEPLRLGRNADYCDIAFPVNTPGVSNQHLSVWYDALSQRVVLEDLGSRFGTFIIVNDNARQVTPHVFEALREGDSFMLGHECFSIKKVR